MTRRLLCGAWWAVCGIAACWMLSENHFAWAVALAFVSIVPVYFTREKPQ